MEICELKFTSNDLFYFFVSRFFFPFHFGSGSWHRNRIKMLWNISGKLAGNWAVSWTCRFPSKSRSRPHSHQSCLAERPKVISAVHRKAHRVKNSMSVRGGAWKWRASTAIKWHSKNNHCLFYRTRCCCVSILRESNNKQFNWDIFLPQQQPERQ